MQNSSRLIVVVLTLLLTWNYHPLYSDFKGSVVGTLQGGIRLDIRP